MTPSTHTARSVQLARERVHRYFSSLPPNARGPLRRVRSVVRSVAPKAVDSFSYGIPAFRLDGKPLIWYAAWKEHLSLYPMSESVRRALAERLIGYETSKGTVRLPLDQPVPVTLVRLLIRARIAELRTQPKDR